MDDFGDTERSFIRPDFDFFVATANDVDEASPRTYQVFGSVVIPEHLAENSLNPEVLQFVSWSQAFFQAFDYQVNPVLNITSEEVPNAGNATQMYWGTTPNSPLV
ncbi:MAG: hypothetical protein GWO23_24705, partial [Gammaproteobacteria bacterium]|nr:hypothetical protein [Gammaproteobacteria bacterium]NIR49232.1 hypothetical protein [candidate division KSB1 bacterium]NIS24716.1 hypothetical protein [candidate division KSB1 bacterium]NIU25325.1 hypothetical protein [candidate division KSB1 bacterium]NIW19175.1 hypothetical protein [candidate division KSB1 bacterium]